MTAFSAVPSRLLGAALTGLLAVSAAACGGGGSPAGSAAGSAAPALSPARVLSLAASQASQVTSFTASLHISSSGIYASRLTGTLAEQTRPVLLAHQKLAVTAGGTAIPGGMETLLTSNAVYIKMKSLSQVAAKPWVKIPVSSITSATGADFAPLFRQMQADNPLSVAQMLPASSNVREVGTATVDGVATTGYTGTLDPVKALTRLDPSLRKILAPTYEAAGITTDRFTVWVDSAHQIRKLAQAASGPHSKITSVMVVTSVNQPVHIQVPPASETAPMPGT
jgi:hypothetical protein